MPLDEYYVEKAKRELRETDTRKSQSLQQFRDWLAKHPFLKKVRQDDIHLLQFLRAKKFNLNDAFQVFENVYLAPKIFPKFTPSWLPDLDMYVKFLRYGGIYPLSDRDSDGCRIVFMQLKRLDADKYTIFEGIQFTCVAISLLMEEEETQICGMKLLIDYENITIKHLLMPNDLLDFMEFFKATAAGRQKGTIAVNLPPMAHYAGEMIKNFLSPKLKNRFFLHRNWNDLRNGGNIDVKMLPKELGGVKSEAEMIQEFEDYFIETYQRIAGSYSIQIDYSKIPIDKVKTTNKTDELVGSFRTLEID